MMKQIEFSSIFVKWFFFYVFFVWLTDLILFCCFYLGISVSGNLVSLAVGGLMIPIFFLFHKKVKGWWPKKIAWIAVFFILYSFGFFFLKALLPDQSMDVLRYHVLLQEPIWRDMIHDDLCSGAMQGFTFPLGDRLFYLFRKILGYRMGTIWTWFCFLLIACQIYRLFYRLGWKDLKGKATQNFQIILAFFLAAQYDVLMQLGSYMVEMTSTIILLECVWFLLEEKPSRTEMTVFAAILGLLVALKVINLIYVIPLLLLYLWKNRKQITVKRFFLCFLTGFLPVSIYMIHNWVITKNPVFPYYNNLFHSPYYYADVNFKDKRWGGYTWYEILLWPVYVIVFPEYRASEIPPSYTWGYAAAWVGALVYCADCLRQRKKIAGKFISLGLLVIGSSFLWSITVGHIRYYMGGFILLLLWGTDGCRQWLEIIKLSDHRRYLKEGIVVVLLVFFLPMPFLGARDCMAGREWSFRMPISTKILPGGLITNLSYWETYQNACQIAGRDRSIGTTEQKQLPEQLIIFDENSAYSVLFQPQLPLISWTTASDMMKASAYEEVSEKLEADLKRGVKTYSLIHTDREKPPNLYPLFYNRFSPGQVQYVPQLIVEGRDFYLVELENPNDPFCDLTRQQCAAVVGAEEIQIGNVQPGEMVTLWIGTSGLDLEMIIPEGNSWLKMAALQLKLEKDGEILENLEVIPLDLTRAETETFSVMIPEFSGQVCLTAKLILPEEAENLSSMAYIWVKTSLAGRQKIDDQEYIINEFGKVQQGFFQQNGMTYYANYYGQIQKGWKKLDNKWYYFSPEDGAMKTGWLALGENLYYLGEDGVMVTGRQNIDGMEYRFDKNGHLQSKGKNP